MSQIRHHLIEARSSSVQRLARHLRACLPFLAFLLLWGIPRIGWITCDGGVPAMWEYGYFVTDEGYYLDGGKEKLLYGDFVDLTRTEAFTYGFSPGTHWLAYLALSCFGLSYWAFRIPFILIGSLA